MEDKSIATAANTPTNSAENRRGAIEASITSFIERTLNTAMRDPMSVSLSEFVIRGVMRAEASSPPRSRPASVVAIVDKLV